MKIDLNRRAIINDLIIEPGEYLVTVAPESSLIKLTGRGQEYKLKAIKRPARAPVKHQKIYFGPSLGDPLWIIVISMPPKTEWVSYMKVERRQEQEQV